jgi:superfamily II DNA or RNA helicase
MYEPSRINVIMAQTAMAICEEDKKSGEFTSPLHDQFADLMYDTDVLVIDEAHHVTSKVGMYSDIFKRCMAEIRIGFTATLNKGRKETLTREGFLGQVIGQMTIQDGVDKGLLAKPKVKLIPVPINTTIAEYKTYKDLYKYGIILNRTRNRLIVKEAAKHVRNGKSVLIMITDVANEQGKTLKMMARELYGIDIEFVQGKTPSATRDLVKESLQAKKSKCVAATTIWREGTNIPSLDVIINGCGGKSEITTLQAIGRGLRTFEDKDQILLVDFLDPYKTLAQHTIARIITYIENGCM